MYAHLEALSAQFAKPNAGRAMATKSAEPALPSCASWPRRWFPLLTLWQSFAENFYPIRADMTPSRYISEEFASYLMTGRPVLAHRELSNALSSILRPRGMQWFQPRTAIDSINEDQACKEWLDRAGAPRRRGMYDRAPQ